MADEKSSFETALPWLALAAGVVGIGAAAMQERTGSGSAARVRGYAARAGRPRAGQKHVVTYSAPGTFQTLSLCAKHDTLDKTHYTDRGQPFATVSHGRHFGMCDKCEEESGGHDSATGSMARSYKVTQKRLDEDETLFERRFGGLVTNENGDNIALNSNDYEDLQYYLDNHTLWTHVEGDGGTYLLPGLHHVNHIDYYISSSPWTDADLNTVEIAWTK